MKKALGPLLLLVVLGIFVLISYADGGSDDCPVLIEYDRYPGTSPVPDYVKRSLEYETVTIFMCDDGILRGRVVTHGGD